MPQPSHSPASPAKPTAPRARLGAARTFRLAGVIASAGFVLVLLSPAVGPSRLGIAIAGWGLTGVGMAVVWPTVASTVGAARNGSARGLSAITTTSYGGGLAGPAVIEYGASAASIHVAIAIPATLALAVAAIAPPALRLTALPR